jgi:hypothetical protein
MATTRKAAKTGKKKATRKKATKKKAVVRKKAVAKKAAARKKPARKKVGKKVARKKAAKKSKVTRKKAQARKKSPGKKKARSRKKKARSNIQVQLEQRVDQLAKQLKEVREFAEKGFDEQWPRIREYADKELALQKRRVDKALAKVKEENAELKANVSKFIEEHETLKGVTDGIAKRARDIEARIKKVVTKDES